MKFSEWACGIEVENGDLVQLKVMEYKNSKRWIWKFFQKETAGEEVLVEAPL